MIIKQLKKTILDIDKKYHIGKNVIVPGATYKVSEILDNNEIGEKIREIGHEFGVTTGRPRRCGWFDAVTMKYACLVGGLTSIALTKIDVFDSFDEIKICTAYKSFHGIC